MDVVLRPITIKDTPNIFKWRNCNDVKKNLFTQKDITEEQHLKYFHDFIETKKVYQFIIVAEGNDCGTVFLKNVDFINRRAEFGIFIGESIFRGKGIGFIATSKMIEIGFKELLLDSIYLTVFSNNINAIKSYEKAGFKKTNIGEKYIFSNGLYTEITKMEIERVIQSEKGDV